MQKFWLNEAQFEPGPWALAIRAGCQLQRQQLTRNPAQKYLPYKCVCVWVCGLVYAEHWQSITFSLVTFSIMYQELLTFCGPCFISIIIDECVLVCACLCVWAYKQPQAKTEVGNLSSREALGVPSKFFCSIRRHFVCVPVCVVVLFEGIFVD